MSPYDNYGILGLEIITALILVFFLSGLGLKAKKGSWLRASCSGFRASGLRL